MICASEQAVIIDRDVQTAFQLLTHGLEMIENAGIRKVDGNVRCFQDHRYMMNSNGFQVDYEQTPVDFYLIANDSYGKGYSEKKWPGTAEIERVIHDTVTVGKLLDQPVETQFSGPMTLIFPPEIFESFLSHFLLTNLYGSLVVNRQSRFSLEDFQNHRQILRDDFNLIVNNLLPYRAFSYICTSEGIPAAKTVFIESGKLLTPILNLKYARKTGMTPTSALANGGGYFFSSQDKIPEWEELLANTERALIVYSILGMHTQDASSGNFSLTADQCILVEKGQMRGKVKAVINGDFLDALNREESKLCRVEGEDNPGFGFTANAMSM
jgi:PmbA protein